MKRYTPNYSSRKPLSIRRLERRSRNKLLLTILLVGVLLYAVVFWVLPNLIGSLSIINRFKSKPEEKPQVIDVKMAPPVLDIPYEATNTATINIKGYSLPGSKVEIYLDDELASKIETKGDGSFISENINLTLGTNNIKSYTIDEKGNKSLPSKTIQITYDNEKPKLEVNQPADGIQIKGGDKKVNVSGTTEEGAKVFVNETRLIVGSDGHFSQIIDIKEGENNLFIKAEDASGNTASLVRKVTYQPS